MKPRIEIVQEEIDKLFERLNKEAISTGYQLNPDTEFTKGLVESLLVNEKRYGYQSCPCRLASKVKAEDLDIICPCYYRDADVAEFGACVCGLYVSKKFYENKEPIKSVPERRPRKELRIKNMKNEEKQLDHLSYPVWRCEVCGYICARSEAPDVCPICGATRERFTRFI